MMLPMRGSHPHMTVVISHKALHTIPVDAQPRRILGLPSAVLAGVLYCSASASMVLLNKHALASFNFTAPNALLCFQCMLAVVLVKLCEMARLIRPLQPLTKELVMLWFPVTCIFVMMLGSGFYALQLMGIGMFSVWKQLANLSTALGDVCIFRRSYSWPVWGCLTLMIASALIGASTDAAFTWRGYTWQVINCVLTSAYALCLRHVMDKVPSHTADGQRMDEFSMVYYNNVLSVPPLLVLVLFMGEAASLPGQAALANQRFQAVALLGGIIGFAISFSSLWFLSQTTATIYSLIGSLNKFPIAAVGLLSFREPTNAKNLASIVIGLGAGVLFTQYKGR